ncbi:PREDICTED: uncharacterized protein LOC105149435 [Acromyrmex echinatior]|uniref:uncharacterized protein LOC105149435 n=1 Tax=Acromyrmex echinatior TaxID=103372 RepID=UPI000580EC9A|nr:PREDICTED: uncharacterized protein LOC105149435 [Acromyrmex echinatior]
MTKITIINCIIVAVCIFQTAEAGLLNPLGPLLNTVSNTVENVKELGKEGIQNGKETYDKLTGLAPQTELSTSSPCTNADNNIQEAVDQVMQMFNTCLMKTNSTSKIKEIDVTESLQNVSKNIQDALNCIHDSNITECLNNVKGNIFEIVTKIKDTAQQSVRTVILHINDVRECLVTEIHQLTNQTMSQIIQYVKQCVQSFTFTLPFKL